MLARLGNSSGLQRHTLREESHGGMAEWPKTTEGLMQELVTVLVRPRGPGRCS